MASAKTYNEVDCKEQLLFIERSKDEYGGYRQDLLANSLNEELIDFYICTKCNGLLRNACQVGVDQNLACEMCVVEGETSLPMIKSRKKIPEIGAKCPLVSRGCVWKGIIGEVDAHLNECTELIVICLNKCEVILKRSELTNHCENECLNRKVNCMHCKIVFQYKEIDNHLNICPELPLLCIHECMETFLRKEMSSHIEKDCPNTIAHCINRCGLKMKRSEISIHSEYECQHRIVSCDYCDGTMIHKELENHHKVCLEFPLICPNECLKRLIRKEMSSHIEKDCPNTLVHCINACGLKIKRRDLSNHCAHKCQHRIVSCEYCVTTLRYKELEYHYKLCLEFPLFCPNECQRSLMRKELELHIEEECPNTLVACPYKEMGCDVLTKRSEIQQHEKLSESNHLKITVIYYSDKVKSMKTKEKELASKVETVEAQMKEKERDNELLTKEVRTLKNWLLTEIKSKLIYKNSRFNQRPHYEPFSESKQDLEPIQSESKNNQNLELSKDESKPVPKPKKVKPALEPEVLPEKREEHMMIGFLHRFG